MSLSKAARVKEVASHYTLLGGFSPFNELTKDQAEALGAALTARGVDVPVYTGFRHWSPYVREVIPRMVENGHRDILAIIMAPHQSKVSWDWYQQTVTEAIDNLEGDKPVVNYLDPWFRSRGYITAITELIREACKDLQPSEFEKAALVFTAHAIPQTAAKWSPYTGQFRRTAGLVAGGTRSRTVRSRLPKRARESPCPLDAARHQRPHPRTLSQTLQHRHRVPDRLPMRPRRNPLRPRSRSARGRRALRH